MKKGKSFIVTFYSLNCDFQIKRKDVSKEINFFNGFGQEIILPGTVGYYSKKYEYNIKIKEIDTSNYKNKMCMLYLAGYESSDNESETEIVLVENLNQKITFNKNLKSIRFLYPHPNPQKDLAININIINSAKFNVKLYMNSLTVPFLEDNISKSQVLFISQYEMQRACEIDTLCNIIAQIECTDNLENSLLNLPTIEIFFRPILNVPTYLKKNEIKNDFSYDYRRVYLYTDVGENDIVEITVNYLRDFGKIYGKIVKIEDTTPDKNAEWRGLYDMPSENMNSLEFNGYTKKLIVNEQETKDCKNGCYLLISIQVPQTGDFSVISKFYPFSILTRLFQSNYTYLDIPKIIIDVDEYIVGNVDVSQDEKIYQFYEILLPYDSDNVEFEFQSEVAELYINLDGERPTTKDYDFILLSPGRDSVITLDKTSILKKAKNKKIQIFNENSLENINLVIGIWANKTDSDETEIFSLNVHLPGIKNELDILEINAERKVLCSPKSSNNKQYNCLFMITYSEEEEKLGFPLLIHAESTNHKATTYIYGNFINRNYYEENNVEILKKLMPNSDKAQFNTQNNYIGYIKTTIIPSLIPDQNLNEIINAGYETNESSSKKDKYYFFVNVVSDKPDDISIYTSMPRYNLISLNEYQYYPNPNTENLLYVPFGPLKLTFFTKSSLITYIVSLEGEINVYWSKEPNTIYSLNGKGDRLALTSGKENDELIIEKKISLNNKLSAFDNSDSIFYILYYARNPDINFDKINYGSSYEISYKDTDLPIYLYSKLGQCDNDINIAITCIYIILVKL